MRKSVSVLSAAALTMALAFGGQAAHAEQEPPASDGGMTTYACPEYPSYYAVSGKKAKHIGVGKIFKNGKGGTVTASNQSSLSATLGVSASFGFSAGALLAKAEASYNINASATATATRTETYSRNIAKTKYGNLQYGNWGWKMNFKKYTVDRYCKVTKTQSGTISKMPSANTWGYRYWETSS